MCREPYIPACKNKKTETDCASQVARESSTGSPPPHAYKHCSAACRLDMHGPSPRQSDYAGPRRNIFPASPEKSCRKAALARGRTARALGCSEKRGRGKPGPWSLRNRFVPPAETLTLREQAEIPQM